jgi:hypothetical protein
MFRLLQRSVLFLMVTSLMMGAARVGRAGSIIGVEFDFTNSDVISIDQNTGAAVRIGLSGYAGLNSLARNSAGTLYSVATTPGTTNGSLITINPNTGAGTFVASVQADIRELAFSPSGDLFGIRFNGSLSPPFQPDDLVKIDVHTGAVTTVGNTGLGLQSLAFSPSGTLYSYDLGLDGFVDKGLGLVTLDPTTGKATDVNPSDVGVSIQALTYSPGGTLYAVGNQGSGLSSELFTVNTSTGGLTLVGSGGFQDARGIEFLSGSVPEPASLVLLAAGLITSLAFWKLGFFACRAEKACRTNRCAESACNGGGS